MTKPCKYGDPFCPCQDGDACHYEGENPMRPPSDDLVNMLTRAEQAERERDATLDLLRGCAIQLFDARIGNDWLTVSNVECAIEAHMLSAAKSAATNGEGK